MSLWDCAGQVSLLMWALLLLSETFVLGVNPCERLVGLRCCNENPVKTIPHFFIAEHDMIWCGIMWSVGISCPSCVLLPTPACSLARQSEKWRNPWCCAGTVQQQCKHSCAITTLLVTNPKQSTMGRGLLWRKLALSQPVPSAGLLMDHCMPGSSNPACWNWGYTVHLFFLSYLGIFQ